MEIDIIQRPDYLDQVRPFINKSVIKILTGQRRIGKSYVMKLIMQEIRTTQPTANIIYIDKELEDFSFLQTHTDLNAYIISELKTGSINYLFIDEVQEIESFQLCLRSLLNQEKCDIYCTGSNAKMLSGELATLLAGRYVAFPVHGLSYKEFLDFNKIPDNNEGLNRYLTIGGMPYLHHIGLEPSIVFEYLKNVYASILLKDVVSREGIRNVSLLENLVMYLADNTGSLFSALHISKYLKSQRINIPTQSVINYIKALTNAYFIHKVSRADINGLKIFEIGEKFYFEDLGLRNCIRTFNYRNDIGKLMENVVYLHLLRNGYQVFVGKSGDQEIDFVAEKNGEKLYIQVAYLLTDDATFHREFGNLASIPDNYPKYVVTLDELRPANSFKGIQQTHLRSFLMTSF